MSGLRVGGARARARRGAAWRSKLERLGLGGALLALALGSTLCRAAETATGDLGPFRLGMSFEEARAAAPGAAWSEIPSRFTQETVALEGKTALRLDGQAFDITLTPLSYKAYRLEAVHSEQGDGARESSCRSALVAAADALAARFGALGAITPLSEVEQGALPIGLQTLSLWGPAQPVTIGKASRFDMFRPPGTGDVIWLAGRRAEGLTILVGGRYLDRHNPIWPSTCVVSARIGAQPPRPAFEWLDLAGLQAPPKPSIVARRHSFDGLASLPQASGHVEIACDVDRPTGRLSECQATNGVAEVLARPAERQGDRITLQTPSQDPDKDVPLRIRLTLRIDPADAIPPPPPGEPILKPTDIVWARRPSGEDLSSHFPDRANRLGLSARIDVLCRMEADGELFCPKTTVAAAAGEEATFQTWGETVETLFRAAPTLTNGAAAAGRWVTLTFVLRSMNE